MIDILDKISRDLNVPLDMLEDALILARDQVRQIKIPKKDGSIRRVYQPSRKLKTIQYWLIQNIFQELKVHHSSTAFLKNKSIKINASLHKRGRYFLKLDFENFFPSIKFLDFTPILVRWHTETNSLLDLDRLLEVIRKSCFYKGDILPIGYPTSPIISNAVMYEFDSLLNTALLQNADILGNVTYTRYADDLVFSTIQKGVCNIIKDIVEATLYSVASPNLIFNLTKTRFVSSSSGSTIVTGLRICHDGHITIHRKYKDKVRLMISLFSKGLLDENDFNALKGHLAYIRHVDPPFFTKLQHKYFNVIARLFSI